MPDPKVVQLTNAADKATDLAIKARNYAARMDAIDTARARLNQRSAMIKESFAVPQKASEEIEDILRKAWHNERQQLVKKLAALG